MTCPSCGIENKPGRKFCVECGSALAFTCPSCGNPADPSDKFCGECGAALASSGTPAPPAAPVAPESERRLVSVLFADLVGFTALSESRDAEEVRELLSRYFDTARQLIARYGGTVEKFIGDAVMAVWGAPVAQEDDAERAVRAALELVDAVAALGDELGASDLAARAGVLTGEAAVTIGAEGQGMVAGDLVNTAARIQAEAEPGTVLVGDATRRATDAGVEYEDAGTHPLKGKSEPLQLWRPVRVVAGVRGALKASGLEAPFVGRERELRHVKDLFHACAEDGKAHLISVTGIGGIGKSRLTWEFFKYLDGLADNAWWHRGRCLAYGDGVAYWALADMVRMRARIDEGEDAASATAKLRTALDRHVPNAEERRWIEPRLGQLLGLGDRSAPDRDELFSAWRLFFERLSDEAPTIMVFEDMQWADAALLEFVSHLLEWSRDHPIFVVALARPELSERHPTWSAGKRNFTSLYLEPLPTTAMDELLSGLVPGLPDDLRARILARAEGVPLYAVETVRMLIDRGLVVKDANRFTPIARIEDLDVPETLHALIAARLDGLTADERRLLQDASVLGKAFTREGAIAVTGIDPSTLDELLASLVRKEILGFHTDPRSSERGQYTFLQDLVKRVAYDTLPKRERKAKHVAVAEYLAGTSEEEDLVEIIASHYVDAHREAPDEPELKIRARDALLRAGERAASLAATEDAQRSFDGAGELSDDVEGRARAAERGGDMAARGTRPDQAKERYERAIEGFRSIRLERDAARVSGRLGEVLWQQLGRIDEGVALMESALAVLGEGDPDETTAMLIAQVGRLYFFKGDGDVAMPWIERALQAAEDMWFPEVLAQALNTKSLILSGRGRAEEAAALLEHALDIATQHDFPAAASRAMFNLSNNNQVADRWETALQYDLRIEERSRMVGDRVQHLLATIHILLDYIALGRWDDAMELAAGLPESDGSTEGRLFLASVRSVTVLVLVRRGEIEQARTLLVDIEDSRASGDAQDVFWVSILNALVALEDGRLETALSDSERALTLRSSQGLLSVVRAFEPAFEAAFGLARLDTVEELLGILDSARVPERTPSLRGTADRFRGRLAAVRGDRTEAVACLRRAVESFREAGTPFPVAVALLELAEHLVADGHADEAQPALGEAREIFERLRARPWLERLENVSTAQIGVPA